MYQKINIGERNYAEESLKLYKKGLKIGCFLEKGFLSKFTYANVVAAGLMAEYFELMEQFINDYKNKLQKNSRNSAFSFNMAQLLYAKDKDYETALNLFS